MLLNENLPYRSYIGRGWYGTITPAVIRRNMLENPVWYTSYTPYQAEVSQGRLEALFVFQTMISDLTGLPLANCSLLDEATAAAESVTMMRNLRSREQVKNNVSKVFVDEKIWPNTLSVLRTRAAGQGIEIVTGSYAVEKLNAEVIIMDDGYQHWQLDRDLDIVLVDTLNLFGNGNLLPRGILREPLSHLDRADMFLFTKSDQSSQLTRSSLVENIRQYNTKAPVVESIHHAKEFVEIADWYKGLQQNLIPLEELKGKKVMVFSAIGNPSSFEQNVSGCGLDIVEAIRYPDHHDYGMLEMQYIGERAAELKADALITTGKDAVKIPTEFIYFNREIPLYVMNMDIMITRNEETFDRQLKDTVETVLKKTNRKSKAPEVKSVLST